MASRIVVIEADPTAQRMLREVLEGAGYDVAAVAEAPDGLRLISKERPALVLLDVALPASGGFADGFEVVTAIRRDESPGAHLPIIVITAERDVDQKIRSLRAGADDYLVKPTDPTFHPAELLARIRGLLARHAPPERAPAMASLGRVLSFYGAKGGVGTTTLAINTAVALQHEGRSVCLVDGNLQLGDHRVFLDLGPDLRSIVDVVSAPSIDPDLVRRVLAKHESGIELLLAPATPESADLIRPDHLSTILSALREQFDYVIVDIDRRLDDANLGLIEGSDSVYIVITADLSCLKNVRLVLQALGRLGYDATKFKLVLNRSTAVTGINVKSAEGALKRPIDYRVVNDYRSAISALNSGAPFQVSRTDSALGKSITELARAIDEERPTPAGPAAARPSARPAFLRR
jgi:pilus assembly protein CpaE